jgi:serine/threonine-protein kinase HipA
MAFKPQQKLQVLRTLSTGRQIPVGVLAQNRQGVFFQYDEAYLQTNSNLSPFHLKHSRELQLAPKNPHTGLHGVFADALPDGWGLLLQDRVFRQHGLLPAQLSAMDRLAFVGHTAIGALAFEPVSGYAESADYPIGLAQLGLQAQALFDGQTEDLLQALVTAGSSGGARPKAQIYFAPGDTRQCRTRPAPGDAAWLVKFTSRNLPLGHEEGLCEAAYLGMAKQASLAPTEWQLLDAPTESGASQWLALKRFDWISHAKKPAGRLHMHSACGLLDADFRSPSLDYETLIKASRVLCKSPAAGQLQFRRAMFNLFACNQDDHSKNWAFLQHDNGTWEPAPFYDVTFSPQPFAEHLTAFAGFGKNPPAKAIQQLANAASFTDWRQAQQAIAEIVEVVATFGEMAKSLGVKAETIRLMQKQLEHIRQENKGLYNLRQVSQ